MNKIAIISANGLGDALLTMVLTQNLVKNGYQITTFSNYLTQLLDWFPNYDIKAIPNINNIHETFVSYDKLISTDGAPLIAELKKHFPTKYKIFYEADFCRAKTVLENFLDICHTEFKLPEITKYNGLVVPKDTHYIKHANRVILHPTSTCATKNWPQKKFIQLALKLTRANFTPAFIVGPAERESWEHIIKQGLALPEFANLSATAKYIYESGFMIGNDSGIGHLASNLGIPTLSLFARKSIAGLWRPNWSPGLTVTSTIKLPSAKLQQKYWKNLLTVRKVMSHFTKLNESLKQ
jgi:heptosyltransferase III